MGIQHRLHKKGYIHLSGQIVDALWFRRRSNATPKARRKRSRSESAREIWPDEPAKAAQKDVDARWTPKIADTVWHHPTPNDLGNIMLGLMQQWPLLNEKILDHAATQHPNREVVSRSVEGASRAQ